MHAGLAKGVTPSDHSPGGPLRSTQHEPGRHWRQFVASALLAVVAAALVAGAVIVNVEHLKLEPVLSGSMRPGVQPGDLAVVRPVSVSDVHVGDVISYLPPHQARPVLHRIFDNSPEGIITKGDANRVADPWGRVKLPGTRVDRLVTVIPKVGFLLDIRSLLLAILGGIFLVAVVVGAWATIRPRRRGRLDEKPDDDLRDESATLATDLKKEDATDHDHTGNSSDEQSDLLQTSTER